MLKEVLVPDIGDYSEVSIIEVSVAVGDTLEIDSTLMTLETDKATVEIPSPFAGTVTALNIQTGGTVSEGDLILTMEVVEAESTKVKPILATSSVQTVDVPDIGDYSEVSIIEVSVAVGDTLEVDSTLLTLETDKATVEIPSPFAGVVKTLAVKVGDKVSQGNPILTMEVTDAVAVVPEKIQQPVMPTPTKPAQKQAAHSQAPSGKVHAGPGVRRFARELGADLSRMVASGPKGRILKEDVQRYVKGELARVQSGAVGGGLSVEDWPEVDFAKYGGVQREPLSRIQKLSGAYLHRNWVMVPHVTQFDEADITDLEAMRQEQKPKALKKGIRLTPLVYIMKALVSALQNFPKFNASLDVKNSELVLKQYFHIGVAVDTPNGLMVPVVRDVDQKDLFQVAEELGAISLRAREGKLSGSELQGSSFSISSLGGIGGTAFTPIVNVPDVAILGVSKAQLKPVYMDKTFVPRLQLPLSLSYDHRVIDGAEAARFSTFLVKQLTDIRQLLS